MGKYGQRKLMPNTPRAYGTTWICLTCADDKVMAELAEVKEHALKVHGINLSETKGTKRSLLHLDGSGFYSNHYEWDFGTMKLHQSTTGQKNRVGRIR